MSIILAIETSSGTASAAILHGSSITMRQVDDVANHSLSILPMIQTLLADAGLTISSCSAVAFGSGPGSFTGVRTACGVTQGLAFGLGIAVIPIVTLLALAEAERLQYGAQHVLCALDARMGEVYWAQYRYNPVQSNWDVKVEPTLSGARAVTMVPPADGAELALVGNGFAAYPAQFEGLPVELVQRARNTVPMADAIARLALPELIAGRVIAAQDAQPLYLRNKVAQTIAERQAAVK